MLSFYEFDCLLRKEHPPCVQSDKNSMLETLATEQPSLKDRILQMLARKAATQTATPTAPAAPTRTATVEAPTIPTAPTAATPAAATPAAATPAAATPAAPKSKLADILAARKAREGQSGIVQPTGEPERPAIVTQGHSAYDPANPEQAERMAGELKGDRFTRGKRGASGRMADIGGGTGRGQKQTRKADAITQINGFLLNPGIGWRFAQAVQDLSNGRVKVPVEFLGQKDPKDPTGNTYAITPEKFRIAQQEGGSAPLYSNDTRKEWVIPSWKLVNAAIKKAFADLGSGAKEKMPERTMDFRGEVLQSLIQNPRLRNGIIARIGKQFAGKNVNEIIETRFKNLETKLRDNNLFGKMIPLIDLAQILGKKAGRIRFGENAFRDPLIDLEIIKTMAEIDQGMGFNIFSVAREQKGKPISPTTQIIINNPEALRNASPELSGTPIAAGGLAAKEADVKTKAAKLRGRMTRDRNRSALDEPLGAEMARESQEWMDIQDLLEHWEF